MKKTLATLLAVVGLAAGAFSQGTIAFNNASGGGLVYLPGGTVPADVFTISLFGGASSGNLQFIATTTGLGAGFFYVTDDVVIPGVPVGTSAFLQLQATAPGGLAGAVSWSQLTGGNGAPAAPGIALSNPDLVLAPVPEPTTMALAGLGAAAMLIFRRRK